MARWGGCQCGSVRFRVTGEPGTLYVCHCRECRKQSASAFGMSLQMAQADLELVQGEPVRWTRPTDSGRTLGCWFCPTCGSRLWHVGSATPETVTIKAGSLDEPVDFGAAVHIWTKRKLPGVPIPAGAEHYEEEPPG